jgi:hypothetical protein
MHDQTSNHERILVNPSVPCHGYMARSILVARNRYGGECERAMERDDLHHHAHEFTVLVSSSEVIERLCGHVVVTSS